MSQLEAHSYSEEGYVLRWIDLARKQFRIIVALMLRDLTTRFMGSKFGFLVSIAWPIIHIVALISANVLLNRLAPYGDNSALWFATGIVPFMAFSYMARFIMLGIVLNRPLLNFPVVKITDVLLARAFVEILSASLVVIVLIFGFFLFDIDFMPLNVKQAFLAIGACMLMGVGTGIINAIIAAAVPMWTTGFALVLICLWISSGVFFVAHAMPAPIRYALSFNPLTHGIEWMRSAYYEGYGDAFVDKWYLVGCGLGLLWFGLLLERMVRGRIMR